MLETSLIFHSTSLSKTLKNKVVGLQEILFQVLEVFFKNTAKNIIGSWKCIITHILYNSKLVLELI